MSAIISVTDIIVYSTRAEKIKKIADTEKTAYSFYGKNGSGKKKNNAIDYINGYGCIYLYSTTIVRRKNVFKITYDKKL